MFFYFEELIHAWDKNVIKLNSKQKINREYLKCIECLTIFNSEDNFSESCKYYDYGDIKARSTKCLFDEFKSYSIFYSDIIQRKSAMGNNLFLTEGITRFEMHSDVISHLTFNAFKDDFILGNKNDWFNCVYYFEDSSKSMLANIFRSKYLNLYNTKKVKNIAFEMLERYGGGKFPLYYLSNNIDSITNHKVFEYFYTEKNFVREDFHVFLSYYIDQLDSKNRVVFFEYFENLIKGFNELDTDMQNRILKSLKVVYNNNIISKFRKLHNKSSPLNKLEIEKVFSIKNWELEK